MVKLKKARRGASFYISEKSNLLFILILLFSCSKDFQNQDLTIDVERIQIPISENELNSYYVYSSYHQKGEKLITYNRTKHSFDFFDLEKQTVLRNVLLERQGPNGIGNLEALLWVAEDSVFAYERGLLYLLDEDGQVREKYELYKAYQNENLGEPVLNFYFKLNFNKEDETIYFFQIPMNLTQSEKVGIPLVSTLNISTMEVNTLPIYHSDFFGEINGDAGFLSYTGFTGFLGDKMIYNRQYESELYSYQDGTTMKSEIHENKRVRPLASTNEDIDSHAINETHFLSPIPDNYRKVIYRPQWGPPPTDQPEKGFMDKTMKLSIFNDQLNLNYESSLPSYTYSINNWFVNSNGLYINVAHPGNTNSSEDYLVFDIFRVE
ncbi:DUF4221 family protein [Algoriphagus sediminis]|uniref:DUF4221 family protein n=1 Tax=Algoriphagus sediminis TaxID=3057113 RepID=A0ABT7YEZ0_9BACT|nr:DUF4221 family protein [Algoriphagus sediminis]MDN3205097.1 DUF4221 family protein [Algoriphagus sediminis]